MFVTCFASDSAKIWRGGEKCPHAPLALPAFLSHRSYGRNTRPISRKMQLLLTNYDITYPTQFKNIGCYRCYLVQIISNQTLKFLDSFVISILQ